MCGYEVEMRTETRMRAHRYDKDRDQNENTQVCSVPACSSLFTLYTLVSWNQGNLCGRAFGQPFPWSCLLAGCLQYKDKSN